tara:strand:- start:50 stop:538 length:489 start_codon:yes stop_codon:yes gene_type:complete
MCRIAKFTNVAYNNAISSKMTFKHGAIITKGSRIVVSGFNYGERTKALGQIHGCVHAEIDVANQLINRFIRKKTTDKREYPKYLKKYMIWVVRAPRDKSEQEKKIMRNSIPCKMCTEKLLNLGFTKIGYSTDDGCISIKHLKDIKGQTYTSVQRQYRHYFKG